ncbi:MAG TPA: N-6 DNA methylase, partial [Thermoleophilia bacterium]|nr:N-6 DNA methylase [Thermoleophilia bacterium]
VILLPDNLFYNTTAAGIIVVLNRAKPAERRGKVLLVNASSKFQKGRPKNFLPDEAVRKIAAAFRAGHDVERLVKVVTTQEIAAADFNLSPSRYVETAAPTEHRDIQAILDELAGLDAEAARLDADLKRIFSGLGYRWEGTQ